MSRLRSLRHFARSALLGGAFLLIAAVPVAGQLLLDPNRTPQEQRAIAEFEEAFRMAASGLACSVEAERPRLNFAFRFQGGFVVSVPLAELNPAGARLILRFRVSEATGGSPVYFQNSFSIPPFARAGRLAARLANTFEVGPGRYMIDMILKDEQGKICRKTWTLRHQPSRSDRAVSQSPPGAVRPILALTWPSEEQIRRRPYRLAVFVHATPLARRRAGLTQYDVSLLATSLVSLFSNDAFAPAVIAGFSLQEQRQFFRSEEAGISEIRELIDRIQALDLNKVELSNLANRSGPSELLEQLVTREVQGDRPPDALVFLGPSSRYEDRVSSAAIGRLKSAVRTPVFHLRPVSARARAPFDDSVARLVKSLRGKVFSFHDPRGLAEAIAEMEQALERRKASSSAEPTSGMPAPVRERRRPRDAGILTGEAYPE